MNSNALASQLRLLIQNSLSSLKKFAEPTVSSKSQPDKWSPKEILGHLIDSAANNHQRFVRAQQMDNLVFPGYDQVFWVERQGYQQADWQELVGLWSGLNLHLARVIDAIPDEVLNRSHTHHNLDRIAFRTVPAGEASSLAYFIGDYVDHLEHHLRQIDRLMGL